MIILIVVWLLLSGIMAYAIYKREQYHKKSFNWLYKKNQDMLNLIKVKLVDDSNTKEKNLIIELTRAEQTQILEQRLRGAGQAFCVKCGHVAGLRYIKDGRPVGCTIQNVNGEKRCQDCLNK